MRPFTENDYSTFEIFWKKHDHMVVEEEMLSPVGLVVERDGKIIGGTWIYLMNGS